MDVLSLTKRGESLFAKFGKVNAKARANGNIGGGALVYKGAQGTENPQVSIWELSLFGGIKMIGADDKDFTSKFEVMTGPKAIKDRAEEKVKRGTFIRTP